MDVVYVLFLLIAPKVATKICVYSCGGDYCVGWKNNRKSDLCSPDCWIAFLYIPTSWIFHIRVYHNTTFYFGR